MSYQQPPDHPSGTPAGPPPGWHPDPGGMQVQRWWDGVQWSPHTRPLPGAGPVAQAPYPDAAAGVPYTYTASHQGGTGRHRQQAGTLDGTEYIAGLASASYPASSRASQPQPTDLYQPQQQHPYQSLGRHQQRPPVPGPQPEVLRALRRSGKSKVRNALIGVGALIAIIVAVSAATVHSSPSAGSVAANSTASAVSDAPSATGSTSSDCDSRAASWRNSGGESQLNAVIADMNAVKKAATSLAADMNVGTNESSDESALQSAAASLLSDTTTAESNLPPSCIPKLDRDYEQALTDYSTAADDWQNAVSELGSGDDNVATGDVNAGTQAKDAGNAKFNAAAKDLQAFNNE
jgi:hypothetical protein